MDKNVDGASLKLSGTNVGEVVFQGPGEDKLYLENSSIDLLRDDKPSGTITIIKDKGSTIEKVTVSDPDRQGNTDENIKVEELPDDVLNPVGPTNPDDAKKAPSDSSDSSGSDKDKDKDSSSSSSSSSSGGSSWWPSGNGNNNNNGCLLYTSRCV